MTSASSGTTNVGALLSTATFASVSIAMAASALGPLLEIDWLARFRIWVALYIYLCCGYDLLKFMRGNGTALVIFT